MCTKHTLPRQDGRRQISALDATDRSSAPFPLSFKRKSCRSSPKKESSRNKNTCQKLQHQHLLKKKEVGNQRNGHRPRASCSEASRRSCHPTLTILWSKAETLSVDSTRDGNEDAPLLLVLLPRSWVSSVFAFFRVSFFDPCIPPL